MTREEAIEIVRRITVYTGKELEALTTLIPEFVESEDEKALRIIRKRMCYDPVPISDEDRRIVENWLEKKKEQKPIFKKGDKVLWDGEEFNILKVTDKEYNVGGYIVPFSRQNELHPISQKQEWNEEDEEHLKWLCRIIHSCKNYGELSLAEESELGNWIDKWLNHNPQPHWKPTEEQMEALRIAYEIGTANESWAMGILKTLYSDLKKL